MPRLVIGLTLVLSLIALWRVESVQSFTLQVRPVQTIEAPFHDLLGSRRDIPTPQFLRIVIDDQTGSAVIEEPYIRPFILTPYPQLEKEPELASPVKPQTERKTSRTQPDHLIGIEALLLRSTKTIMLSPQL